MAVGDIINGVDPTSSAYVYFQPAAGVEIIITFAAGNGTSVNVGIYDGTSLGLIKTTDNADYSEGGNVKIGITNTIYYAMYSNSNSLGYSGIQTK